MRRHVLAIALLAALSGCAGYHPAPLPVASGLDDALPASVPQPLTLSDAATLALARSPNLLIERRKAGVSKAQAYASGLLPDPQFTASVDHPTVHGVGLVNAYALGIAQELQSLLTEHSRAEGAKAKEKQAELDLLWAEWQTLQKTVGLCTQKYYLDEKSALLTNTADLLDRQYAKSRRALTAHDTTLDVAGADLSTALDIASQRDDAVRAALTADADLRMELNLGPHARLVLADPGDPGAIGEADVRAALGSVASRRPDLLALQAGYHAQEESVRTAILQQFPAMTLGFNRASDPTNVQTNGLSTTINIPIFGTTQANIATERATRAELGTEYQTRLDQTVADAWRIWRSLEVLRSQIGALEASLPELEHMARTGQEAYAAGNLSPATYVVFETSLAARQSELFDLKSSLWSDTLALKTVLAMTPLLPGTTP